MRSWSYWSTALLFTLALAISGGSLIDAAAESGKPEPKRSGDISEAGKTEKKDTSEAPDEVQALKTRIIELQNKGKLPFRKIVLCRSAEGFGIYSPLEPGEPISKIVLYCEPSNVSTMLSGDRYVIDCMVDAFIMDSAGKPLIGKENILRINRISRSPVIDLYFKVEIVARKLPAGKMLAKIVLHDKIKNQSVSVVQRINVEPGSKKGLDKI